MKNGIGEAVRRKEDHHLLVGEGCFSDDVNLPGQAYAVVVRAPHAHARITAYDTAAAAAAPGVLAVLTGADYLADGLPPTPANPNPPEVAVANRDGREIFYTPDWPIVTDKVRRVGQEVVLVVAESEARARDAAELVVVEYDVLPAVTDPKAALAPGAPLVWDEVAGNLCIDHERGDKAATDAAFAGAAHVTRMDVVNNRITGVPLEPRAAVAEYDAAADSYTLHAGSQNVVIQKDALREIFAAPEDKVRVVCRDVGGGFGTRNFMFAEFVLAMWAARRLGRPVKWTCERGEGFLSDPAARDIAHHVELALDADGRFLAMRVVNLANIGARTFIFVPFMRAIGVATGVYHVPVIHAEAKAVFTHTVPVSVYRGAGRPEGIYVIERLVDTAAHEMGIDPVELRRRNLIPVSAIPYTNAAGVVYDSGTFEANMDGALKLADWDGFTARREDARRRGRRRGIGICNYIETTTGMLPERAEMDILPHGRVQLVLGTLASGQGHETAFAQIVTDLLGVPYDHIDLHEGDTARVKAGMGSHSSRSMRLGGTLLVRAADDIIAKGKRIAAHVLEAAAADIEFQDGVFTVAGTDRTLGIFEAAAAAAGGDVPEELRGRLEAAHEIHQQMPTFPCGCHICEVEVDPDTGAVEIVRYGGIDDVGRVINPLLVDGQTHGGIAQGVGQAMMEECAYDSATGQLLSGSLMDYCLPSAADFPFFELGNNEVPAPNNPLGIKGAGEGGTTGAPGALINAIVDALRELGVRHVEMPATPERVWRAIRAARGA